MAVPRRAKVRTPAPAAVVIESHPTRVSPLIRGILAAPACDSPRYRCHSHPLALVLISHAPAAPRGARGGEAPPFARSARILSLPILTGRGPIRGPTTGARAMDGVGVSRTRPDPCTQHGHCRRAVLPWPSQSKAMGIADVYLFHRSPAGPGRPGWLPTRAPHDPDVRSPGRVRGSTTGGWNQAGRPGTTCRIPGNKKPPGGWSNPDTATIAGWESSVRCVHCARTGVDPVTGS